MPSSGVLPTPLEVEKSSRKVAFGVFALQLAAILTIMIVLAVRVAALLRHPVVGITRRNTSPDLPYVYFCPSNPEYFGFVNSTVHAGCAKDATVTNIPVSSNGLSTFRIEPGCSFSRVTIKIQDRIRKAPVETPCLSFKLIRDSAEVRWRGDFYLLFNGAQGGTSDRPRPFYGYNGVGSDLIPETVYVYLSDVGGEELVKNEFFLRSLDEIRSSDKLEVFEQGEVRLPPNLRTDFQVIKTIRRQQNGDQTTRYPVEGAVVSYPVNNLREAVGFLHGLPQTSLANLTAVYVHATLQYDQVELREQDLLAIGLSLIGTYGGLFPLIGGIFFLFFTNIDNSPTLTLRTPWKKLPTLVRQVTHAQPKNREKAVVETVKENDFAHHEQRDPVVARA